MHPFVYLCTLYSCLLQHYFLPPIQNTRSPFSINFVYAPSLLLIIPLLPLSHKALQPFYNHSLIILLKTLVFCVVSGSPSVLTPTTLYPCSQNRKNRNFASLKIRVYVKPFFCHPPCKDFSPCYIGITEGATPQRYKLLENSIALQVHR